MTSNTPFDLIKQAEEFAEFTSRQTHGPCKTATLIRQLAKELRTQHFKPDWNELEACRESLREHMQLIARYKDLLRQIAYPRRGTDEENMDIYEAGKLIQSNFSLEELE